MKKETQMHSAEWYRGAVAALRRLKPETWSEPRRAMSMRDLRWCVDSDYQKAIEALAAAEAREAGEKRGQPCTCLSHQFVECRGAEQLGKGWVCQRQKQQSVEATQPSLADQLAVVRAERDAYKRQCDSLINDVISEAETQMARDERMKLLGAAEALEDIAKDSGIDGGKAYFATVVYREFPDRLTTQIGVVEAADIMQRAAQLRQQAEAERLAEGE